MELEAEIAANAQADRCRGHAVVYVAAGCCLQHHEGPEEVDELGLASFDPLKLPPALNGRRPPAGGSITQLLPQVRRRDSGGVVYETGVQPVASPAAEVPKVEVRRVLRRRHRKGGEVVSDSTLEDGVGLKDLVLGAMIGAALTVFLAGLLIVWLIG